MIVPTPDDFAGKVPDHEVEGYRRVFDAARDAQAEQGKIADVARASVIFAARRLSHMVSGETKQ